MCLNKLLSLKSCCYIKKLSPSKIVLTPLGNMVKQNILNEIISSFNRLSQLTLFDSSSNLLAESIPYDQLIFHKTTIDLYENDYRNWLSNNKDPFGIAQRFLCKSDLKSNEKLMQDEIDCLSLTIFCSPNQSLNLFQRLQSKRNQWWKNLSKSPFKSKFKSENINISKEPLQHWVINYLLKENEIKDMDKMHLENVKYFTEHKILKRRNLNSFHSIICDINLDHATLAFLFDGIYELDSNKIVMKLNSCLAPFKVAFYSDYNFYEDKNSLDLVYYLKEEFISEGIQTFPLNFEHSFQAEQYDELGIPYTIRISKNTAQNGVIFVRNRDTRTEEEIHVSQLVKILNAYINNN